MRGIRFTIGRRLALLGGIGLAVAVISNLAALILSSHVRDLQDQERNHLTASKLIRQLDTRASELKVDGYKALLSPTPADLKTDLADDTQTVTDLFTELAAVDLHDDDRQMIANMQNAFNEYVTGIGDVIDAAIEDQTAARKDYEDIQTANDTTDEAVGNAADTFDAAVAELEKDAQSTARTMNAVILLILVIGVVVVAASTVVLSRAITLRVRKVVKVMKGVAAGDLSQHLEDRGNDEIADISAALDGATTRIRTVFGAIGSTSAQLRQASGELTEVAGEVGRSVTQTSDQAQAASRTADDVSSNVQAVAAGGEEMTVSIAEIARNAQEAARVAVGAVSAVESTTGTMNKLGDSSREIGDVVKLITSIAEQTNLLALNATIEAARAGDAGKGFAVVADEVKQLAQETARATEDISRRVETIQEDADSATSAITQIADVIQQINEFQTTIASAVEEQTATTQTINAGVAEAAGGSGEIARNISGVASAANAAGSTIGKAEQSARELAGMSDELSRLVSGFRF
ncbi:methyl-accepting chemotaxis protein [Kineosporia sp. J2-2]|uniref:Methyl-accepting chemotaxis protein n=1 Tax=Kineosporia corallincola TaxID=2835133 RepID=A0ABS5TSJ5_9ACTN|nr:methyl-accepting chemotaxis protein [Kineosporia corallincola]MBT0773755.1 methyl-accepting chemotaxis protein [Kineosporia corallincola]